MFFIIFFFILNSFAFKSHTQANIRNCINGKKWIDCPFHICPIVIEEWKKREEEKLFAWWYGKVPTSAREKDFFQGIYETMATSNNGGHYNGNVSDRAKPSKDKWSIRNEKWFSQSLLSFTSLLSDNFHDGFSNIFFLTTQQIVYWKVIKDFVGIRVEKGVESLCAGIKITENFAIFHHHMRPFPNGSFNFFATVFVLLRSFPNFTKSSTCNRVVISITFVDSEPFSYITRYPFSQKNIAESWNYVCILR